jgi:hypothetical protein
MASQDGLACLSHRQRKELKEFRRKNHNKVKHLKSSTIVKIWRDGYICGAIHGYDQGTRKLKQRDSQSGKKCKRGRS